MLRKLLKYEIKRSSRQFMPFVSAYLLITLVYTISNRLEFDNSDLIILKVINVTSFLAYFLMTFAVFIFGFFISVSNFNRTLYTDEGYLMLTIPVKPYYHIIVKIISSLIWTLMCTIVFVSSLFIIDSSAIKQIFSDVPEVITYVIDNSLIFTLLVIIYLLASFVCNQIMFYFIISFSNMHKYKSFYRIILFFALAVLSIIVTSIILELNGGALYYNISSLSYYYDFIVSFIVVKIVFISAYFFGTNSLITKYYNL